MQPSTTPRPVMDVMAPPRSDQESIAVREAPVDIPAAPSAASGAAATPAVQESVTSKAVTKQTEAAKKPKTQRGPVAVIVLTIIAMLGLSALAIAVYLKS